MELSIKSLLSLDYKDCRRLLDTPKLYSQEEINVEGIGLVGVQYFALQKLQDVNDFCKIFQSNLHLDYKL